MHAAIDDHSRLAYVEIHPDEKTGTRASLLADAAVHFADRGITRVERLTTDNAWADRPGTGFALAVARSGAVQWFIKPHRPWTDGKVERLNRTFATEWARSRTSTSNTERATASPDWLEHDNMHRPHLGIDGLAPIDRVNNAAG